MFKIAARSHVKLGFVPTHLKFVGGLVPDDAGRLPTTDSGESLLVERTKELLRYVVVPVNAIQIPWFYGTDATLLKEVVDQLSELGLEVTFILMLAGADPMEPADEDQAVHILSAGLQAAHACGIKEVSSTSIEEWMKAGAEPRRGDAFTAAVSQNVKVHQRVLQQSGVDSIQAWHMEFLRSGEFQTFTNIERCWSFVDAVNQTLGTSFFKVLVDAAHCGDSDLSIEQNQQAIREIAAQDGLGIFHASAKTTRGCLSTDDGWINALLTTAAETGKLSQVMVEVFHHQDPALEGLRKLDSRHGVDTTDGRSYDRVVCEGLEKVARSLNFLVVRGILKGR